MKHIKFFSILLLICLLFISGCGPQPSVSVPTEPPIVSATSVPDNKLDITDEPTTAPTEEPTKNPTPSPTEKIQKGKVPTSSGRTVWINTKSGYRYHLRSCQYVKSSSTSVSLETAKARGYTPCKKCGPGE